VPRTLIIYESKYGLSEAIAHDVGRILGPARVCRARDVGGLDAAASEAGPSPGAADGVATAAGDGAEVAGCGAAIREATFVVLVTPVYRHALDERILDFARANRGWLCRRHVALVCVGLATSPGAVGSYLRPLTEVLGDCVVWTGGLGGHIAMDWLDTLDGGDVEGSRDPRANRSIAKLDAYPAESIAEVALDLKAVRDSFAAAAPSRELRRRIDDFLAAHDTCALCTGAGDHVRATPLEYLYRDGELYLLSEGGEKFAHLMVNPHVSVAVHDPFEGMDSLAGLQLMGRVDLVPEGSEDYLRALGWRGLEPEGVAALPFALNLLRVHLERAEFVWSGFKELGYARHQVYDFPT
jgi:pyridoxamine 5'-phosphate oxidase-like protein